MLGRPEPGVQRDVAFARALRTIAGVTAGGGTLDEALRVALSQPDSALHEFSARVLSVLNVGADPGAAIAAAAEVDGPPDAELVAEVLSIQHRLGGDVPGTARRLADAVHTRVRMRREVRAATAGARTSLRMVLALPAAVGVLALVVRPDALAALPLPVLAVVGLPMVVALVVAALIIGRMQRTMARQIDGTDAAAPSPQSSRLIQRIGGSGPVSEQAARLATAGAACAVLPAAVVGGAAVPWAFLGVALVAASPWMRDRARRRRDAGMVRIRLASVCDIAAAVLAAGGGPGEALRVAVEHGDGWLAQQLGLPADEIVTPADIRQLRTTPIAAAHPELGDVLLALELAGRYGDSAQAGLEVAARDAASGQREAVRTAAAGLGPRIQLVTVLLIVPAVTWAVFALTAWNLAGRVSELAAG